MNSGYSKSQRLALLNNSLMGYLFRVAYKEKIDGKNPKSVKNLIEECIPGAYNIDGEKITFDVDTSEGVMNVEFKEGAFIERRVD